MSAEVVQFPTRAGKDRQRGIITSLAKNWLNREKTMHGLRYAQEPLTLKKQFINRIPVAIASIALSVLIGVYLDWYHDQPLELRPFEPPPPPAAPTEIIGDVPPTETFGTTP